jgi:hypothetical protein
MQLTYSHKRGLIQHLSARAHWKNVFDEDFFTTPWRKGSSRNVGNLSRFINDSGNRVSIDHPSGASVKFELLADKICIGDESGRQLIVEAGQLKSNELVLEAFEFEGTDENTIDVPGTKICVRFKDNGDRTIVFSDLKKQIKIPFVASAKTAEPLPKGAQIHVATLTERQARAFGLDSAYLLDATKLVIAIDLGIDPDLKARNTPQGYILYPRVNVTGMPEQWKRGQYNEMELVQKPWLDTTQFEGHDVPLPNNFFVEVDDGAVNVITSLDQREAIWSQGDVFKKVTSDDASPIRTVKAGMTSRQLLKLLGDGHTVIDGRGREWSYILVESSETRTLSPKIRGAVSHRFGLTARHCAVLTIEQDVCLVAMNAHVLDTALARTTAVTDEVQRLVDAGIQQAAKITPSTKSQSDGAVLKFKPKMI